jgi:hypothetical protein
VSVVYGGKYPNPIVVKNTHDVRHHQLDWTVKGKVENLGNQIDFTVQGAWMKFDTSQLKTEATICQRLRTVVCRYCSFSCQDTDRDGNDIFKPFIEHVAISQTECEQSLQGMSPDGPIYLRGGAGKTEKPLETGNPFLHTKCYEVTNTAILQEAAVLQWDGKTFEIPNADTRNCKYDLETCELPDYRRANWKTTNILKKDGSQRKCPYKSVRNVEFKVSHNVLSGDNMVLTFPTKTTGQIDLAKNVIKGCENDHVFLSEQGMAVQLGDLHLFEMAPRPNVELKGPQVRYVLQRRPNSYVLLVKKQRRHLRRRRQAEPEPVTYQEINALLDGLRFEIQSQNSYVQAVAAFDNFKENVKFFKACVYIQF